MGILGAVILLPKVGKIESEQNQCLDPTMYEIPALSLTETTEIPFCWSQFGVGILSLATAKDITTKGEVADKLTYVLGL